MKTNQILANECLALACFCAYTADSEHVISGAFDCPTGYFDSTGTSKTFNFSIHARDETLVLNVDAYTVANEFTEFTSETWDVDAWTDQMITLELPTVNRENFYALARAARALISGRSVCFSDGTVITVIPAIGRVAA